MRVRIFACCLLLGLAVFLYPVLVAPTPATLAIAGCALASLTLGLITSRWLGAGLANVLSMSNYALTLSSGASQPVLYAPALAVATWLFLELFDLAQMSRRQARIETDVFDAHRRRLITTFGVAGVASVAVLLAGVVFQAHPALLPAAAIAGATTVAGTAAMTRRAVS